MTDYDYIIVGGGQRRLRAGGPAQPGPGRAGAAAGGGQRRAAPGHGRPGRVAATDRLGSGLGRRHHRPGGAPGRCPTRAGGGWAAAGRSTRWPTCAATGRCTTPGPPAARPAGGTTDLLPYFKRSRARRRAATRPCAGPAARSGSPRSRRPAATRPPARSPRRCARSASRSTGDLSGKHQEGVAWPDLAIAGGKRVSPDSAYLRPAPGPAEPHRRDRLPGHPAAHPPRPVHRRRLPARRGTGQRAHAAAR